MEAIDRLELRYEVARKAIHLSSLSIPVIYWFISRELALLLLVPLFRRGMFSGGRRIDIIEERDEEDRQKDHGHHDDHGKE